VHVLLELPVYAGGAASQWLVHWPGGFLVGYKIEVCVVYGLPASVPVSKMLCIVLF
jgi:hypothetical protein